MLKYNVNGREIFIKPSRFEGHQTFDFYEKQIYKTLKKIGIEKEYIKITTQDNFSQVNWIINNKEFSFKCQTQEDSTKNLGAISKAIQDDVRQIMRGIKTLDLVMKQYSSQTTQKKQSKIPTNLNSFTKYEEEFKVDNLKLDKEINEPLDPKYNYLLKETNDKLDILYLKFKEECRKSNTPDHPLFKALKIIRQQRGLKL